MNDGFNKAKEWVFQRKLSFNATTLDKNCDKNQEFPLPPIINVVLGHAVQGAWGQQHWNWRKGFFRSRLGNARKQCFCQNILFGLSENFKDLVIILSKIVRKCYQSFISPFEHKESHILKQTEFNYVPVMGKGTDQCLPFDSTQLKSSQLSSRDFWSQASVRKS